MFIYNVIQQVILNYQKKILITFKVSGLLIEFISIVRKYKIMMIIKNVTFGLVTS